MTTQVYRLIDTHAHLDEVPDVEKAIEDAKRVGVVAIVAVGQDYDSNLKVLDLAAKYNGFVYPALGLHPWAVGAMSGQQAENTFRLVEDNIRLAVAIGEIGLDYDKRVRAAADKEPQKDACRTMLELARRYDKPVSFHSRYSWKDSFDLVREAGMKKTVFHWYAGFSSVLREIIAAGYFISATPAAEYHDEHRRAVRETPIERLLLETDCPVSYGRETKWESRPADIVKTLKAVSQLRGMAEDVLAETTTENAVQFFGLRTPTERT